jgi:hypothetical protein
MSTIQNKKTKKEMIQDLIVRRVEYEKNKDPKTWGLSSLFYEYAFDPKKLKFDHDVIVPISSNHLFSEDGRYCYFIKRCQRVAYQVIVIRVEDCKHAVIRYLTTKKESVFSVSEIRKTGKSNDPNEIKGHFYNGYGKIELFWW